MRILLVTNDFSGAALCCRLLREGHDVRAVVRNRSYRQVLEGIVEKVRFKKGLQWVGKDGLIVFDDCGFGALQDDLRGQGYAVIGGSEGGDWLEANRRGAQMIFEELGMLTVPSAHFDSIEDAIEFLSCNQDRWVVKQNGHANKCFSYDGRLPDCSDVINLLQNYQQFARDDCHSIDLQKRVFGVEIGVARYFNGEDWVGPIEMNIEHKKFFPFGMGPRTPEMGTLMWYDDNEDNRLFIETLSKLKPYLRQIAFRGDIDINCIVNEAGAIPLEATPRFGYPAVQLQMEFHRSPWGEFLKALATGEKYDLQWRKGYGVVVLIATTPFPFYSPRGGKNHSPRGLRVYFRDYLSEEDFEHIHFEEIALAESDHGDAEYYISGDTGYVMHVSGFGSTVEEARRGAYSLIDNIFVPKMYYRHDIGLKFLERDIQLLNQWGYLN